MLEDLSKATKPAAMGNGTVSRYMLQKMDNILSARNDETPNFNEKHVTNYNLDNFEDSLSCSMENNSYHSANALTFLIYKSFGQF